MSPELRFVATCCRWPADQFQQRRLTELAQAVGAWETVASLAEAHRVEGLVWRAVLGANLELPPLIASKLRSMSDRVRTDALRGAAETLRICRELDSSGIEHRVFKGYPLAMLAYGSLAIKNSIDIDLLVRPPDVVMTAELLAGLGYSCAFPPMGLDARTFQAMSPVAKEACFVSKRGQVDLHWSLINQPALLPGIDPWAEPRHVELLPGHPVRTLPECINLAYLVVHGAAGGWSRLKWLADFSALLAVRPEAERKKLCEQARAITGTRIVDQALILVERLFGPALVPDPSGKDAWAAERLSSIAVKIIEARRPDAVLENDWHCRLAISRTRWVMRGDSKYRFLEAVRAVRRQELRLRLRWPLRTGLHWLYLVGAPIGVLSGLVSFVRRAAAKS